MIASANYDQFSVSHEVDKRFFWWLSHSPQFTETVRSSAFGVVIEKMVFDRDAWLDKKIPLPPLAEQRRIVARIDEVVAKIEEVRGLRRQTAEKIEAFQQSTVEDFCFKRNFQVVQFGDVLESAANGLYKPRYSWGSGLPCIRMYNIDGPSINRDNLPLLDVTNAEAEKYGCVPGDLIFNRVNSAELVGKTGIVPDGFPACTFEAMNMRLRVKRESINSPSVCCSSSECANDKAVLSPEA